jgi:general secretion pathway protein G
MKNKIKKNGFTLIELIVVVTIIAVLTVVGVISYGGTNKKARDSRRMADLEKIAMALEVYRQDVGSSYPPTADYSTFLVTEYIQALPKDPKTGLDYTYNRSAPYTYTIRATVEDAGSSNVPGWIYEITNP